MVFGKSKDKAEKHDHDEGKGAKDETTTPLIPNRTFWIVPHTGMTHTIQILDLTNLTKSTYPSEDFEKEVKEIANTSPPEAWLTISSPKWYSKTFTVEKPGEKGEIATWKGGSFSSSKNTLVFPEDSSHSSHPVEMKADNYIKFREQFVKDSVAYEWKPENVVAMRKFTLTKNIGGMKTEVAKFWSGWGIKFGGGLVLNSDEVDDVVAVVSMVNVLRKKRQKLYEYGGGSGGGGGGS